MSRRLDIELTSRTSEDTFTWRAAGARQPKGTVEADLVPEGNGVGSVLRAEVESGLDGIEVVSLLAKAEQAEEGPPGRIEIIGPARRGPDVSVSYAPGARRRRPGEGPARREGGPRRQAHRPQGEGEGDGGRRREGRGPAPDRGRDERTGGPPARRERRAPVSTTHRNAMLAELGPQEMPVAEQLLRGGIPAVRQAIAEQNASGTASVVNAETVLSIAEQLVTRVNLANWKDRASAAQAAGREARLRELRAVVTASRNVNLDDEGRTMAKMLREALDQRVKALQDDWVARMVRALEEGRVGDALGVSARPPEPGTRLPADLAVRLAEAAGTAMTAGTEVTEWLALLEVVVDSTVRRSVKPSGIPEAPEAQEAARRAAGSVPELAKLLGLRIPPPPPRRTPPRRPPVMAAGGGGSAGGH
ncbi:MAG: hypothetical protein ACRDYZ_00510 [Acidimicrobiales bacterium]